MSERVNLMWSWATNPVGRCNVVTNKMKFETGPLRGPAPNSIDRRVRCPAACFPAGSVTHNPQWRHRKNSCR